MAFDFPNSPTVGQLYTAPTGLVYTWDGEKWGSGSGGGAIYISDSAPAAPVGSLWWESDTGNLYVSYNDGNSIQWVMVVSGNAAALLVAGGQTTIGGFRFTSYNAGTIASGTLTPDAYNGNYQYYTNNGAHTLAAPANDCAIDILVTNSAAAGAITFTGFTVSAAVGDPLTTTSTNKFIISIRRINATATYTVKALQ